MPYKFPWHSSPQHDICMEPSASEWEGSTSFYSAFHSLELLGGSVLKVGVKGSPEMVGGRGGALSGTWALLNWPNLYFYVLTINILLNCVVACAEQLMPSRVNEIWKSMMMVYQYSQKLFRGALQTESWGTLPGYLCTWQHLQIYIFRPLYNSLLLAVV
jgi:hypothetical protein